MKGIFFEDIHPFVRNVKRYNVSSTDYPLAANYDNLFIYAMKTGGQIEAGDKIYDMHRGDVLIIKPGVMYRFLTADSSNTFILIDFDYTQRHRKVRFSSLYDRHENFSSDKIIEDAVVNNVAALNLNVHAGGMQFFEDKLVEIVKEFENRSAYSNIKNDALMLAVLADVVRVLKLNSLEGEADTKIVMEILKYVDDHACERLTNAGIGKKFALHPNYLNALVKKETGYSLHTYLLTRRLAKSIEYLDYSTMPIYEISEKCGFGESKNYIRYFKNAIGVTPQQYRKRE